MAPGNRNIQSANSNNRYHAAPGNTQRYQFGPGNNSRHQMATGSRNRQFGENRTNLPPNQLYDHLLDAQETVEIERSRRVESDVKSEELEVAKKAIEDAYEAAKLECGEVKKALEVCQADGNAKDEELAALKEIIRSNKDVILRRDQQLSTTQLSLEKLAKTKSIYKSSSREEKTLKEAALERISKLEGKLTAVRSKADAVIRRISIRNDTLAGRCAVLAENQAPSIDKDEIYSEAKKLYESDVIKMENNVEALEKELTDARAEKEQLVQQIALQKDEMDRVQREKAAVTLNLTAINAATEERARAADVKAERMRKKADMADNDSRESQRQADLNVRRYKSIFRALRSYVDKQRELRREGAVLVDDVKIHIDPVQLQHYTELFAPVTSELFDGPDDPEEDSVQMQMRHTDDWYDTDDLESGLEDE